MKKLQFLAFLMVVVCISACKQADTNAGETSFGAGVTKPEAAVSFADVAFHLNSVDSVNVVMKAEVNEVCQAKGCWMNLTDPAKATSEELFVKFKDYAFFVPKDIAGREVIVEGVAYKEETSVEELRHYAEDAGKTAEEIAAITEPVTEKKFMATGVLLLEETEKK